MSLSDKVEGWAGMPRLSHDFPMSSFADAIAVTPTSDPTIWKADLKRDWCIGLVPHGGYIGSVLTHAAAVYMGTHQKKYNQPDIIASHYEFLARSTVGPCTIHVTPLKLGRQLSNLRVQLLQPDPKDASQQKVCCEALIVQGNLATEASNGLLNLETKPLITKDQIVERANCLSWGAPGEWAFVRPAAFKVEALFPPGSERHGYTDLSKNGDGPSVRSQWMRFTPYACAAQKFKVEDLPYLCDAFAPMPENYGLKGNWYPTVSFAVDVKRGGEWEWLWLRVQMSEARNGRFGVDLLIVDEEGQVVCTSRHVALIVGSERNLSGRVNAEKAKI